MENIYVTSGGFNTINNYVPEDNIRLFEKLSNGKKVLIIANAAPEGTGNYVARENVRENFLKAGATQADVVDLNSDNVEMILDYDIIYGLGGNITHLIELNKNTRFKDYLVKFLETGIYIGESAGSMILANDVKYAYDLKRGTKPKYDVILDSYAGLGLIDIYVYPHFQKASDEMKAKTEKFELDTGISITRLNDGDIITYSYSNKKNNSI
ncbi:MAG: Type 1 glutamine amidotransferase-like domain-containing protein [Bacilli bacterium]|nr:Type 1 glutamine amidotransferase-like domain-containing protein [Bacilli bacterium]